MRRTPSVLLALLLAGGLTACGSADNKTSPVASKSSASSAASVQTGQALFADMTKAMTDAGTASVTFNTGIGAAKVSGGGAIRFDETNFAADMAVAVLGQGKIRVIVLRDAFYLKLPKGLGAPQGKPWIKLGGKGGKNDPMSKAFGSLMDQLQESFKPGSNLDVLKAATRVTKAGTETIDGVETTKYTATVDLAKAAEVSEGMTAEQLRAMVKQGVKNLDYAIWVDQDQLPRKFTTVVPTKQGDVTATGTYSDWGKPVTIKAPPKSQIASPGSLGGSGGSMPGASALAG